MSENENVSGSTGNAGNSDNRGNPGGADWGWEPVPHGGEFDSEATAFVKLPQHMLDALDSGEPLAAPGHGYVPPPMIVPLGSASADPTATGTWTMPFQWPEAGAGNGGGSGADAAPDRGPIPASIPLPPSVAAAYGDTGPTEPGHDPDPSATAEWQFPDAAQQSDGSVSTGQWTLPTGGAGAPELSGGNGEFSPYAEFSEFSDYSNPSDASGSSDSSDFSDFSAFGDAPDPAGSAGAGGYAGRDGYASTDGYRGTGEFPAAGQDGYPAEYRGGYAGGYQDDGRTDTFGGAAPWAGADGGDPDAAGALTGGMLTAGVLPGSVGADEGGDRRVDGTGAGAAGRGPRVLGGPGVGTPLPEPLPEPGPQPEPLLHAGHDIDADHGPARTPVEEERPRPVDAGATGPGDTHGHGFAAVPPAPAEAGAAPAPGEDTPDSDQAPPAGDDAERFPVQGATYEEEPSPAVAQHEHPAASYVLRVNGADRPVTGAWIGESLLYVLRERLGLAGAKDGCSQGECGACAVQVDGRLVASCLVPAATAAGSEVRTVEGLATDGELSDVQKALCTSGAVQCGFCVPGMAMTIHDLLEGNHAPSDLETRQALCGNLCRCSGYKGVIEAVREVVAERGAPGTGAGTTDDEAQASGAPAAGAGAAGAGGEPRIPHQALPGEGGVQGDPGHAGGAGHPGGAGDPGDHADFGNPGHPGNLGNPGNPGFQHNGGMA
ncbi:(2Fe-2S)-binding protein [Streptomyces sp. NPDC058623]|uniref:(2Fe-2S)-binding protein n=1 Tax=Streptomyces sp. NPDC058623 TaxID=3346563 RepID=UPI0036688615